MSLTERIKEEARRLGFILAGVTSCDPPPHWDAYQNWIDKGYHGEMGYLASQRNLLRRADPRQIDPDCQSILVLAMAYTPADSAPVPPQRGQIAAYAHGQDYHDLITAQLSRLADFIRREAKLPETRRLYYYTDTGPIMERDLAQRAGLGWIGKNTLLINPRHGSWFFLAEMLLPLRLETDAPFPSDQCGTCTRCIDACPTQAISPQGREIDARKCISYLTIELKTAIPETQRESIGNWIFGCDICQMVCPWNRFARPPAADAPIPPRRGADAPDLIHELESYPTRQDFNRAFKGTPIQRSKRRGYLRNVCVALGNSGATQAIPALQKAARDEEALVREHAQWALKQLSTHKPSTEK